jgi:cell division protease FtsH
MKKDTMFFWRPMLVWILTFICFMVVWSISEYYDGTEILYSDSVRIIKEQTADLTKVTIKSNNVAKINLNEDGKNMLYKVVIPDKEKFVEMLNEIKDVTPEANFSIEVKKKTSSFVFDVFKAILIYLVFKNFWEAVIYIFFPRTAKNKEPERNDSQENNSRAKEEPNTTYASLGNSRTAVTLNDLMNKMFSNDFSSEIKSHLANDVKISFKDVAGMENVKEALKDIGQGIIFAEKYEENGAKIPSGILLDGEPGTGKTLVARALAGELNIPFIQYAGTEMSSKWVGESEEKLRQIFDYAKANAPCVIFFDEIDSIAKSRKNNTASYEKNLLNQLLTCLDGFEPRDGVIFIAATNLAESLDVAITRPGRFDRIIKIELPNEDEREAILKLHAKNKKLSSKINLRELAQNTATLSGAYLANIMNEAAILQIKNNHPYITPEDINEAHRTVLFGQKSTRVMNSEEKHLTAIHELGHAFTSKEPIKEISIVPRGSMGGYTWYKHSEHTYITSNRIKENLISLLGGRAAEEVILGDISTGAQNDMERAWQMASDYIVKYGMSEKMGPISIKVTDSMSESAKEIVFNETKEMIVTAFESAVQKVTENREKIEDLAKILEVEETMLGEDFYYFKTNNISI